MPDDPQRVVLAVVADLLRARHDGVVGVAEFLTALPRSRTPGCAAAPAAPAHADHLAGALTTLRGDVDPLLGAIGEAIDRAGPALDWRVDDGRYYEPGAPVGDGYRSGNMHTVLAEGDDLAIGLFLLAPATDYLDHRHAAPEFYLNLTGPTRWRFDGGPWLRHDAGTVVWNPPGRVHATTTGDAPWLSLWAWLADIDRPCEVVSVDTGA